MKDDENKNEVVPVQWGEGDTFKQLLFEQQQQELAREKAELLESIRLADQAREEQRREGIRQDNRNLAHELFKLRYTIGLILSEFETRHGRIVSSIYLDRSSWPLEGYVDKDTKGAIGLHCRLEGVDIRLYSVAEMLEQEKGAPIAQA